MKRSLFVRVIVSLLLLFQTSSALFFDATAGKTMCFTEELGTSSHYQLEFKMAKSLATFTQFIVYGPEGTIVLKSFQHQKEFSQQFQPDLSGSYAFCFITDRLAGAGSVSRFEIEFILLFHHDYEASVQRLKHQPSSDPPAILQAQYIVRTLLTVKESYRLFQEQEAASRNTNESTHERMNWLGVVFALLLSITTFLYMYKLHRFLLKNKILD